MTKSKRFPLILGLSLACIGLVVAGIACGLLSNLTGKDVLPAAKSPPKGSKVGQTWTSPHDSQVMIYVPAGEFLMGALEYDEQADEDEIPLHTVNLDGFWIDRTEVTNQMFAKFLSEQGNQKTSGVVWYEHDSVDALLFVEGPYWIVTEGFEDHPVHEVTWFGAQAYCEWVGRRLPTEAEWEKAARGVDGQIYPWGNDAPNCSVVNYSSAEKKHCSEWGTAPVGSFAAGASPFGVFDMAGNLWEWVADWYDKGYYDDSPSDNPSGPATGTEKIIRGGAWESGPRNLRATDRNKDQPAAARYRLGFRCAASP